MNDAPTFLFAGGGSGGHLLPGIALADVLQSRLPAATLLFAGSERSVERGILQSAGMPHVALPTLSSSEFLRRPWRFLLQYRRAVRGAAELLRQRRPAVVIGLGGFASAPVVRAARKLRTPIVLLEQNAVTGRANALLARTANAVCHSFQQAVPPGKRGRNCVVTGNPVRSAVCKAAPGLPAEGRTLLVLGGSQGSRAVNEAMCAAAEPLREVLRGWRIVHQCGPAVVDAVSAAYGQIGVEHVVQPYFDDLPRRYATAQLAVSRAGATTLAELACAGVPAVLIPYPNSVRNHQMRNAEVYAAVGAAVIVEQSRTAALPDRLRDLLTNERDRRRASDAMRSLARPHASELAADVVLQAAGLSPQRCEPPVASPHFEAQSADEPASFRIRSG